MRKTNFWQTCSILAGITALLIFIWYAFTIQTENVRFDNESVYEIPAHWRVQINDGTEQDVSLPANIQVMSEDRVIYRTTLHKQETVCNSVLFRSSHQYVKVYLDGTLLQEYGYHQRTPVKMSPGSVWQYVRLPNDWDGRELTIELQNFYDTSSNSLDTVLLGTKAGLVFWVVRNIAPVFIIILPIIIIGFTMLLSGFYYKINLVKRRMRYLGCFTLCSSIWILLESRVMQLFTGKIVLYMNLIFLLFSLFPLFLVCYLFTYPLFQKSRYMKASFIYMVAAFFVMHALRLFGIMDYVEMVPLIHLGMVLGIAGLVFIFIREKLKHHKLDTETQQLFVALITFTALGCVDIIRFYLPSTSNSIKFSIIGLFCFVAILRYSAIRQEVVSVESQVEQKMLKKLAYMDMLTNLNNRAAFIAQVEEYRRSNSSLIVMMADMNNLKWINDHLGHGCGDQALVQIARLLLDFFGKDGLCYRIGGDEFCVLSSNVDADAFQLQMEQYMDTIQKCHVEGIDRLSIACGFVPCTGKNIDQALRDADEKMYACKTLLKNKPVD